MSIPLVDHDLHLYLPFNLFASPATVKIKESKNPNPAVTASKVNIDIKDNITGADILTTLPCQPQKYNVAGNTAAMSWKDLKKLGTKYRDLFADIQTSLMLN